MKKIQIFSIALLAYQLLQAQPVLTTGGKMPNEWIDATTHHKIVCLSRRDSSSSSFYFHNNPFMALNGQSNSGMLFLGTDVDGRQAFSVNLTTLQTEQLTHVKGRIGSEIIGHLHNNYYYQLKDSVFVLKIATKATKLVFVFPENYKGSIATINADETFLAGVKATNDQKEILKKYPKKSEFFDRVYDAHLKNELFTINLITGALTSIHAENNWLGHVQFSPTDPNLLMFCHEGPWHKVDRIWNINIQTKAITLVHRRTMENEIAGHEWFAPDGKTIWYDLQLPKAQNFFVGGTNLATGKMRKYRLTRDEWSIHFNISPNQQQFCGDGGDSGQVAKAKNGQWIYLFTPKGDHFVSEKLVDMHAHNYKWEPNVHFSPDGKWVIFRANFEGKEAVYAVETTSIN